MTVPDVASKSVSEVAVTPSVSNPIFTGEADGFDAFTTISASTPFSATRVSVIVRPIGRRRES
ncbi:MAG: hypothetical protein R3F19_11275 [Verrucomicrobiales bacterium]